MKKFVFIFSAYINVLLFTLVFLLFTSQHYGQTITRQYNAVGVHTFVIPNGVTSITVHLWGGGGRGGNAFVGVGGGGGGGAYNFQTFAATPGQEWIVNVGIGGQPGIPSLPSTINNIDTASNLTALPGGRGTNGIGTAVPYIPSGGIPNGLFLMELMFGLPGDGGLGYYNGFMGYALGNGGGAAGSGSNAFERNGGSGAFPGGNGALARTSNNNGRNGGIPGGGGSGAYSYNGGLGLPPLNYEGGKGGRGRVIIQYDDPTLTVTEEEFHKSIKISPNPANSYFKIQSTESQIKYVEFYTSLGKKLKVIDDEFNNISFEQFSSGIYLIKIHTDKGISTKKLIKN